jgi:hypothetical protein
LKKTQITCNLVVERIIIVVDEDIADFIEYVDISRRMRCDEKDAFLTLAEAKKAKSL